jgi:hypothetical protein
MELSRLGVKLFAADPSAVRVKDLVPVFHSWIQKQCVKDHQLIDVHDYSHIHHGPGILLVAHEGNFSTDMAKGKLGIAYFRKQPGQTPEEILRAALGSALEAARLIEAEPALEGRLRFGRDQLLVISNDRLLAPNNAAAFEAVKPTLSRVFGETAKFTHVSAGTPDRLTIRVAGVAEKF